MKKFWEENKAMIKLIGLVMMGFFAVAGLLDFIMAIISAF